MFPKFSRRDKSLKLQRTRRCLSATDNQNLKTLVKQNPRQSAKELFQIMGVSITTISDPLKKIGKVNKVVKCVPNELSKSQRVRRSEVSFMLHLPFLDRIGSFAKKWIFYDNRQRLVQVFDHDKGIKHIPKQNAGCLNWSYPLHISRM